VRIGRAEALDLLSKWRSDRALLRCDFSFARFAASLRGRILGLTDKEFRLVSDDTFSELAVPLSAALEFGYGDPRDFPEDCPVFEGGLVIFFPSDAGENESPDFLALLELK